MARGSVADTRLGVEVTIRVLGLCLAGYRSYFIVGTR